MTPAPRRPTAAATAGLLCLALGLAAAAPAAARVPAVVQASGRAEVDADAMFAPPDPAADAGDGLPPPAPRLSRRDRERAVTETAWYLFLVTAGGLAALVGLVWAVGWYKRTFLDDSPLQTELFDAATRAEIERHRKQVQAEKEAAKRTADAESADAGSTDAGSAPSESPGEALSGQTAAPPDPAVQREPDGR